MKVLLKEDPTLQFIESGIRETDNLFSDDKEELDEPIFNDLKRHTGLSKEELEEIAPDTRLENVLNRKEYEGWKKLPLSEKKRAIRRIYASEEYQEYMSEVSALKKANTAFRSTSINGEKTERLGYLPNENRRQFQTEMQQVKTAAPAIGGAKNLTKKMARNISELPKDIPGDISSSDNTKLEEQVIKKSLGTKIWIALKVIIGAITSFGVPLLAVVLPLIFIFMIILSFFFTKQKVSDNVGIMPYYAQADYTSTSFNGNTIATDGCGITSMAMVVSLFKNETIIPPMLAEMANANEGYNTVKSHQAINNFATYYEIGEVEEMGGPNKNCCGKKAYDLSYIQDKMQKGSPVIVSVSGGYYNPSGGGHYIALYGTGTNGVFVYDPGSRTKYKASIEGDGSSWGIVFEEAKHIWIFPPFQSFNLVGGTNEETVYLNLKQAGFSDASAAGVIGNMYQECAHGSGDLNPAAESSDGSIGLLQWTGGRKKALETLAQNREKEWSEISVQVEYLLQELNTVSQWKWTSYANSHYPGTDDLTFEEFKQLSDPQLAAEVFQAKFVRPNYEKSNLSYRKSKAQEVYLKYVTQ